MAVDGEGRLKPTGAFQPAREYSQRGKQKRETSMISQQDVLFFEHTSCAYTGKTQAQRHQKRNPSWLLDGSADDSLGFDDSVRFSS